MLVREYGFVKLNFEPPAHLRWAFRKVGPLYQVRGVGKYEDLAVEPRWGWESVYRMLSGAFGWERGSGGLANVEEWIKERFFKLVEEYSIGRVGYREGLNLDGRGKYLPHRYNPTRPLELPSISDELSLPKEILWLNYILHRLGYGVSEYEKPPEGAFHSKMLDEPEEEVWKLAYVLESGMFGSGDRGFLLNTPYIFEEYVGRILGGKRTHFKEIHPDFVLEDGTPVDAKYKLKPSRSDIYQAFTYAMLLEMSQAVLVYPRIEKSAIRLGKVEVVAIGVF